MIRLFDLISKSCCLRVDMALELTPLVDFRQILVVLHTHFVLLFMAPSVNLLVNQVINLVKNRRLDNRCEKVQVGEHYFKIILTLDLNCCGFVAD